MPGNTFDRSAACWGQRGGYTYRMSVVHIADYKRIGPEAVRALLNFELEPGLTVHRAAWTLAMPDAEYQTSDMDADKMAQLLHDAGLAYFIGNDDQPPALVLRDQSVFRRNFRSLACRETVMGALGTGILIRRNLDLCV
jgi:hypothetical protein